MTTDSISFSETIYSLTRQIPRGKVSTYGQLAMLAGRPGAARAVGNALHKNPYQGDVPCHRVVNSVGRLSCAFAFGGANIQADLLSDEGIAVNRDTNTVDISAHLWQP